MGLNNFNKAAGLPPALRNSFNDPGLPAIRGEWHFVDPNAVNRTSGAFTTLLDAYNACVDERGDGIALVSSGNSSSETTSYLYQPLTWSKNGISVVGISAPTRMGGRARVANKTVVSTVALVAVADTSITRATGSFITDGWVAGMQFITNVDSAAITVDTVTALTITVTGTLTVGAHTSMTSVNPNLITISGANNSFYNVHFGNFGSDALELGCIEITGERNYFGNCHILGAGDATPAAETGAYDLKLNGAAECTFERCTIGSDTIIRAAANGNIIYDGLCLRNRFYDCDIVSYSETAGHGAINSIDATSMQGVDIFSRCRIINWKPNGAGTLTAAQIGTAPTSGHFLFDSCSFFGYTAVGASGAVYVANSDATASGAGGISTTP